MSAVPNATPQVTPDASKSPKPRMSTRNRLLFFVTGWLIVLMPFLFWWNTWFGRQLSEKQLAEYLQDQKHPRHIQHALVQIGEHITRHDASVTQWYPQVVRLASDPVEEVRNTDAWVMGQDTSGAGFHEALLENARRSFADGARKRRAFAGSLRRRSRAGPRFSNSCSQLQSPPLSREK